MREELAKLIKEKREKITDSSVRTYVSLLTNQIGRASCRERV